MTKYRIVNDGYFDYLQYQKVTRFLWFFFWKTWECVPLAGRFRDGFAWDVYVCSTNSHKMNEFPKRWPDIKLYLEYVKHLEEEHDKEEAAKSKEREKRSKIVKNLN